MTDDKFLQMEKQYQDSLNSQKRYYESQLELLKSKLEYEKEKIKIEAENNACSKIKEVERLFNVKNVKDLENQKKYFLHELESQRNWYEQEIIRRCKETEAWHLNHFDEEMQKLKNCYEERLKVSEEKYKLMEENLCNHIQEQQEFFEKELKLINSLKRIKRKLSLKKKKKKETVYNSVDASYTINNPKVSVILPIYNVGKYLRQSLDSLINQTLKEIEIICVDDGSTDDSYDILEEYKEKDSRIIVIHKENKGTGAARNDGLRLAKGECIGFVDPDDWVKPEMYERLYSLIKEKNLDIAMCMPDGFDEKNRVNAPFPYFIDDNFDIIPDDKIFNWRDISPFKYPMCVWNKLYTKELFDKNNIDFAQGLDFEDHKVIFGALLAAEKIFFVREKLYVYRYNREGSVLTDNNRRLIDHIEIFNIVEDILKKTDTQTLLREDFLTYKVHNLLYYYSMIKDEFKSEYYEQMKKSLQDTNLSEEEYKFLSEKYPELKNI